MTLCANCRKGHPTAGELAEVAHVAYMGAIYETTFPWRASGPVAWNDLSDDQRAGWTAVVNAIWDAEGVGEDE